jgi:hypothetical protein
MNERGQYGQASTPSATSSPAPAKLRWWIEPLLATTVGVGSAYLFLRYIGEGSARKGLREMKQNMKDMSLVAALDKAYARGDTAAVERIRKKLGWR